MNNDPEQTHPEEDDAVKKFKHLTGGESSGGDPDQTLPPAPGDTRLFDNSMRTMPMDAAGNPIPGQEAPGLTAGVPSAARQPQPWENLPPGMIPPAPAVSSRDRGQTPTPPPPFSQTPTPPRNLPAVDRNGMPLPRRVDQIDINATRVIPVKHGLPGSEGVTPPTGSNTPTTPRPQQAVTRQAASSYGQQATSDRPYQPANQTPPPHNAGTSNAQRSAGGGGAGGTHSVRPYPTGAGGRLPQPPVGSGRRAARNSKPLFNPGCLMKGAIALMFLAVLSVVLVGSFMVIEYYSIASQLPGIDDLKAHTSQFETTRILDRDGNVLYEILDPSAGRRTYVPLEKISPNVVAATVATEDKEFYTHPGFNIFAISRAMWQNYTSGEIESGASTITQQLARTLLFSPDERYEQSIRRKTREIVLAAEITRRYSKDEILELYLNENNYGNLAYGIEAAAETYFDTTADQLTLAQASFLAGLPQAPAVYDINSNREGTLGRHKQVLLLMLNLSSEEDCIFVSNSEEKVCISDEDVLSSVKEIEEYPFKPVNIEMSHPHWVNYVRSLLEAQFDPQTIYRSGFTVYTTLDPDLQEKAEQVVKDQVASLVDNKASDGALVAIRPSTGEILAMVGSADFYNEEIDGQVNMAVSPRQPGSSIKPLTYVAAFEKGWTPATLIWDVPSSFPPSGKDDDPSEPYEPVNYDGNFHGPVTVRTALSNSYNIPAVKALQYVGIYDDPATKEKEGLIEFAKKLGITTLIREDYGLALTLGGGEVTLVEMTGAFATFANAGNRVPPVAISKIVNAAGEIVYEYKQPEANQVIRAEHAYLISSILSDQEARIPMFGENPVINLPFTAAVKTGTTNDFRDNWTMGYTPDLAVGVWVGNADYTAMENTTGLTGAAPIWAEMMQFGIDKYTGNDPTPFNKPDSIVRKQICAISGTEPSEWCPDTRKEYFAPDQLPLPKEQDLWHMSRLDTWTRKLASDACGDFTEERFTINVTDSSAKKWLKQTDAGKAWLKHMDFEKPYTFTPTETCGDDDGRATLKFTNIEDGARITDQQLKVEIVAYGDGFKSVGLEYGLGPDPQDWIELVGQQEKRYRESDVIYTWDLSTLPAGEVVLKLRMESDDDGYAEKSIHLNMQVPTATPTLTSTPTATSLPTETPTATVVPPTEVPPTDVPPTETPTIPAPVIDTPVVSTP